MIESLNVQGNELDAGNLVQMKPVVTTTAKIIISPVRSTRRMGNIFGETDGVFDMAYSFLYG